MKDCRLVDLVRLQSDGDHIIPMAVTSIFRAEDTMRAECSWRDADGRHHIAYYPIEALRRAE